MTDFESASLTVAVVVAVATCISAGAHTVVAVAIWRGVREMDRDNKTFAAIRERQHQADERRHEEVMAEGARRHEENMAALADRRRGLEALIGGLERQTASLEAVVERTAPKQGAAE